MVEELDLGYTRREELDVSKSDELNEDLRLALSRVPAHGDPLDRGRSLATELRQGHDSGVADLIDALCDDVEGVRRQVARLGFDLHDEGLQDLAALRNDLGLFRSQLASTLEPSEDKNKVVGRVDDFLARVAGLDGVLRGVATSADASPVLTHPLSVTLESLADAFSGECVIETNLDPDLDSYGLTDSQRIVAVRVVQSALSNVLQHSAAKRACVRVRCVSAGIEGEIVDDGKGFDLQAVLSQAVDERRLGLSGMQERVRLLGGTFSVSSRVGGPTRISFALPRQSG